MNRSDVISVVLVIVILTPLVIIQAGPGYSPLWLDFDVLGVPATVGATTLWFVAMMLLAWRFAAAGTAKAKAAKNGGAA